MTAPQCSTMCTRAIPRGAYNLALDENSVHRSSSSEQVVLQFRVGAEA